VRSRAKEMGREREEDAATPGTYSHRRSGGGVGGRGASIGHEFHGEGAAGPYEQPGATNFLLVWILRRGTAMACGRIQPPQIKVW
jgi:hypothetical protein